MGKVGDSERKVAQGFLHSSKAVFNVLDAVAQPFHSRHGDFGRFFGPAEPRNLIRALLELSPQLFDLCRQGPPFVAELLNSIPRHILSASSQRRTDKVQIVPKIFWIVHESPFKKRLESSIGVGESQRNRCPPVEVNRAPTGFDSDQASGQDGPCEPSQIPRIRTILSIGNCWNHLRAHG